MDFYAETGPSRKTGFGVYDLEPEPSEGKSRFLKTGINGKDRTASLELAFEVAEYFDFDPAEARKEEKK